jgi:hypothetical protein
MSLLFYYLHNKRIQSVLYNRVLIYVIVFSHLFCHCWTSNFFFQKLIRIHFFANILTFSLTLFYGALLQDLNLFKTVFVHPWFSYYLIVLQKKTRQAAKQVLVCTKKIMKSQIAFCVNFKAIQFCSELLN